MKASEDPDWTPEAIAFDESIRAREREVEAYQALVARLLRHIEELTGEETTLQAIMADRDGELPPDDVILNDPAWRDRPLAEMPWRDYRPVSLSDALRESAEDT